MKKLPRPAVIILIALGVFLSVAVFLQVYRNNNSDKQNQRLEELNIETHNPQPAGKNVTP